MKNYRILIDLISGRPFIFKCDDKEPSSFYTFVVDSDEALAAWVNNTAGNDYTSILIKPGTWTSNKEVNLTTSGTKTVTGMPGSLLSFTSGRGLKYSPKPTSVEYWMNGVNVEVKAASSCIGFSNCFNLTNCTSICDSRSSLSTGFNTCSNLTNCISNSTGNNISGNSIAFTYCTNLTNCNGTGNNISGKAYGLYECTNLTNCTGTGNSIGIYRCTNLTNCTGNGTGDSAGYGFHSCRVMSFCKPGSTSTTSTYSSCYMHATGTTDPVDDTAAGGWNRS